MASITTIAYCGSYNLPIFDPQETIIDCTAGKPVDSVCDITLVIEHRSSMTYYNLTKEFRQLKGYQAAFDSNGDLVTLIPGIDTTKLSIKPIQADGRYRPIITINAQMPGPTIIAHEGQTLNVTVHNELRNEEGVSIHWHGIHQIGMAENDGVSYITQRPILALHQFTYTFKAFPSGTHWYHAHSGVQRADGLYGALIVKDTIPGNVYDHDLPDQHTLLLMDWYSQPALTDIIASDYSQGWFTPSATHDPPFAQYNGTFATDGTLAAFIPFWSGMINDKGRYFDENGQTNIRPQSLNYFNVTRGSRYRFRLIGTQESIPYRFSVQGHKLTVIASDGSPIKPIENVDYVIVNSGERFDVVINANNAEQKDFWIWAQTLEDLNLSKNQVFYSPVDKHRAEAILHYTDVETMDIANITETWECNALSKCSAVNCPYTLYGNILNCTNFEAFEGLEDHTIPDMIYYPNKTIFLSFGFHGEESIFGSSVDGVNFRFPAFPPLTEFDEFNKAEEMCPRRGCDHDVTHHCACTQVIDISDLPEGSVVEMVLTNRNIDPFSPIGTTHPVHLHGHYFYVVDIGYSSYSTDGLRLRSSDDIECVINANNSPCQSRFDTIGEEGNFKQEIKWRNVPDGLYNTGKKYTRKDTISVPYGGYTVIRFTVDNPGWWLLHCHNLHHSLSGMNVVIRELQNNRSGLYML